MDVYQLISKRNGSPLRDFDANLPDLLCDSSYRSQFKVEPMS